MKEKRKNDNNRQNKILQQETTSRLENILNNVKTDEAEKEYISRYTVDSYKEFHEYFNEFIGAKNLILAEVIKKSNISKNYVYNIINGTRRGSRDKIIALCIGAGMNCRELNRGLEIAKEGILYPKDERDARITIAINRGVNSVSELNMILENADLKIIE